MDNPPGNPRKTPFVRKMVVDHDEAIAYLKKAGFAQTDDAGTFTREDARTTHESLAGARYLTIVKLDDLLNDPKAWRQFVRRWSKKASQ